MLFAIGISKRSKRRFLLTLEKFGKLYKILSIKELLEHVADVSVEIALGDQQISLVFTLFSEYTLTINGVSAKIKGLIFVNEPIKDDAVGLKPNEIADFTVQSTS